MKASPDSHISTDHLLKDLGHRARSGGVVTAAAQVIKFVLNLASAVVLARLLSPHDFGLVAMAGALMPILRTFREGGLSTATIQKEGLTHAQVSNLFWVNLGLGGFITLLGAAVAPAISWFYHDERLTVVTALLALSFLVSGSAVQHLALLNRQMRFKAVAFIDIASATIGFFIGMVFAWLGFGYWSLVIMQLGGTVAETLLTWVYSGWLPQLPKLQSGTRPLLHFGASMTIYIFLRRLDGSVDVMLLGRFFGADTVGLYSRAGVLLLRPLDQFIAPFDTVFIPMLSRLQNHPERYRQVFLQAYGAIALLSFTFAGLLIGLSGPLVMVLLGEKWIEVIPIFTWSTIAALYIPMGYSAMWLLTTQGRNHDLLVIGIISPLLIVAAVMAGLPFGATGLALSLSLVGLFVRIPVQFYITGKTGPVGGSDLWTVFSRHFPLWGTVSLAAWLVPHWLAYLSPFLQLALGGLTGLAAGTAVVALSSNLRSEVAFILAQARQVLQRRKQG